MSVLNWTDIAILMVILLLAFDALRLSQFFRHPLRTVAFVLVTIGAFGWITYNLHGDPVRWWAISMHAGFALYALRVFQLHYRGNAHVDRDRSDRRQRVQGAARPLGAAARGRADGARAQ
jgi:Ca2+/Na+ antiporter